MLSQPTSGNAAERAASPAQLAAILVAFGAALDAEPHAPPRAGAALLVIDAHTTGAVRHDEQLSVAELLDMAGLCPAGGHHWRRSCSVTR